MINAVSGIRRRTVSVGVMAVLVLAVPTTLQAVPPQASLNPNPQIARGLFPMTSTPAGRDDGESLGVALIGLEDWVAVTNQSR
jgi:hypothetical protein